MTNKKLASVQKSGSWVVFWVLLILAWPVAILYWLFKIKKTKVWDVVE